MRHRGLALLMVVLLVAAARPVGAVSRPPVSHRVAVQDRVEGVDGDDACGLLSDEEILAATGATGIVSRQPGPQNLAPAGCYWQLESRDMDLYGPWELYLGVQTEGGRQRFEDEVSLLELTHVGGLGDDAAEMFGSLVSVKADVYVSLQYIAFGGPPRPPELSARALTWLIMQRLPGAGVAALPSTEPSDAPQIAARDLVGRVRAEPLGEDNIDAAMELLARSGIATFDGPSAVTPLVPIAGPESPVRLLHDQVRAMALEAWANGGIPGSDLDELVPPEPGLAPPSWVIAGYVANVETEGAEVARALVGEPDWDHPEAVRYPQLVLTLFTSDLARERMVEAGTAGRPRVPSAVQAAMLTDVRLAQGGLCSAASSFLDATLTRIFDALRLGASGGGSIFARIWDFVVSLAERVVRAVVRELTQAVLDMIGKVAAVAGMVATIVSVIRPWTVTVSGVPPVTEKGVGGTPGQPGQLQVRVDLGGLDAWPRVVEECARVARQPLPSLKPEGAPVTWSVAQYPGGLVAETGRQGRLDATGQARLDFMTLVDEIPAPWRDVPGQLVTTVVVERPGIQQLRDIALDSLFGQLGRARGIVEPFLRPIIQRLTAQLDRFVSSRAFGPATVIYHVPDATPEPDATPGPTAPPREVWVHLERPGGDGILPTTVVELYSCSGPYGVWSGVIRLGGVGPVPLAEFPVTFGFRGAGGVQRTTATVEGFIPWDLPDVEYDVRIDLDVVVDGRTMTLAVTTQLDEQVQGGLLFGSSGTEAVSRTIEPAPPGSC
ncbi:MAG: hypothetical protein R3C32_03320 [Chloroflexota bacterium]